MKQEIRIEDLSIVTKRKFGYGVRKVWRMWSEIALIERRWGPDGFTTTTESFEFAVGGRWVFTMNGPEGTKYPNEIEFTSIEPHASIRYEHVSVPLQGLGRIRRSHPRGDGGDLHDGLPDEGTAGRGARVRGADQRTVHGQAGPGGEAASLAR